jgi:hypothetical protein
MINFSLDMSGHFELSKNSTRWVVFGWEEDIKMIQFLNITRSKSLICQIFIKTIYFHTTINKTFFIIFLVP